MYIHKEGKTILFGLLVVLGAINYGMYYFFPENQMAQDIVLGVSASFYSIILQFFRIPVFDVLKND